MTYFLQKKADLITNEKKSDSVEIGTYRGFTMHLNYSAIGNEHTLTLRGAISHSTPLGQDVRGNLTRIDNTLDKMESRLNAVVSQLENFKNQQAAAKVELGKPFLGEQELKEKTELLAQLDAELNLSASSPLEEEKSDEPIITKSSRPSVLDSLKNQPKVPTEPRTKKEREEVR